MNINPCKEIFLREPVKPGVFRALDNAHAAWQEEPNVGDKYVYFNLKAQTV